MANPQTRFVFSTFENPVVLKRKIPDHPNIVTKRHLELDGKSVKIVEDGQVDMNKVIQSELKNAGLQNILKLQELRYGTVDNAIARASDRGVYADVSDIPDSVGERAEYINKVNAALAQLKAELGLSDEDLANLTADKIYELYANKNQSQNSASAGTEGGQE